MILVDILRNKIYLVSIFAVWIIFSSFFSPPLAQSNDTATILDNAKNSLSIHESKSETSFLQYADPRGLFVMQYSPDWTVEYKGGVTRFDPSELTFKAQDKVSSLGVSVKESAFSGDEFKSYWSIYPTVLKSTLETEFTDVEILSSNFGKYQIAGHEAGFVVYRSTAEGWIKAIGTQFIAIVGNKSITFTFTTTESSFEELFPNVERMVKSFEML
jgi:hypothetical protein